MFFTPNSDPTIWISQPKSRLIRPILVILCELYPPFPVLSWQERHPVWSSAAVAHLLQGSTCCTFRDGILHTLVVTSGYLKYCSLSIISNKSAHSPLTSRHQQPFHIQSHLNPLSSPFWCSVWTSASRLHHIKIPKCIELLPFDWLISNLCYQAIEQVYLIKWPVNIYIYVINIIWINTCLIK